MSEQVSKRVFNQFCDSVWPEIFSGLAQAATYEGVPLDESSDFRSYKIALFLNEENHKILDGMGLIETSISSRLRGEMSYTADFNDFGKEVIMACENLFTKEEHRAKEDAIRPKIFPPSEYLRNVQV